MRSPWIPSAGQVAAQLLLLACLFQFSGWLPPAHWLPALMVLGLGLYAPRRSRGTGLGLLVLVALAWPIHQALQSRLPAELEGLPLWVEGQVVSLPVRQDFGDRILFRLQRCESPLAGVACQRLRHLSLSWGASAAGMNRHDVTEEEADEAAIWPEPGQRWRLQVRLKQPLAPVNPDAFDIEQRLLQQQVDGVGRIMLRQRLDASPSRPAVTDAGSSASHQSAGLAGQLFVRVEGWRAFLRERLEVVAATRADPSGGQDASRWALMGVVTGLSLGDQGAIGAEGWGLFARTGVSHLMAISGMHVTLLALLVSAGCVWLHRMLARHARGVLADWLQRQSRQRLVLVPAVLTAFGYALLSGWGVPAQRTCFMLLAAAVLSQGGRSQSPLSPVVLAAAAVVALDPWSVAQAGFWLSFGAVLALIWCAQQPLVETRALAGRSAALRRSLQEAARNQWAATIFLTPLTVACFSTWSLIGPLANVVAIPWVGFVLTPMAIGVMLLAPVWPWLAGQALKLLLFQLDALMALLRWLDALPWAVLSLPRPGAWTLACALLGAVLLLAPAGLRRVRLGLLCLLPLLLSPARQAPEDALLITALDIGQGSMVLVEQGEHRLLYDTGAARMGGPGTVERVLQPYLNSRGLTRIDTLVLSHLDANHSGGASAAFTALRPRQVVSSVAPVLLGIETAAVPGHGPGAAGHTPDTPAVPVTAPGATAAGTTRATVTSARLLPCVAGSRYPWAHDGWVEVLHPGAMAESRQQARDDRQSCVIRIRTAAGSVLLAGDLPRSSEKALVQHAGTAALKADVLVVPRQGSPEGAGDALLAAVNPAWALLQTNYRNHHGHPHPKLKARLDAHGVPLLRTDLHGAVRIELRAGQQARITRSRWDDAPYWRVQPADGQEVAALPDAVPDEDGTGGQALPRGGG
ncbi:MAG: DNA internalization-related competence protein ComEC/Rec2 [Lautropia sp.]|nr:DNA internalization-related competence protein ComEC/Rec2 [Lautropia sp.]